MSQLILDPVLSGYNLAKVNDNFKRIEEAFNTLLLHKDGSKALTSDLDVNSQKLLNVGGIEIGGVDLLESIVSLQESYSAYISEMEAYKRAVEGILDEAISYGAVDKKSIGNAQAVFTTNQAYAKNSNLTLPLKYIVGKNTLSLSLGHTYLLYKGVDYEEVGVVGEESQTIKILRASGIGVGVTIEQVVDGDNDLIEIFENAQSLYTLLTTNYSPTKVEEFINSVSDVKELGIEDKISELWGIYNNLSALQVSFANTVSDINTKYSTITDMYEDVSTKYSLLETLYPQLVALIADTDFNLDELNTVVANILSAIQELQALTGTIESNAQTASTAATSASTSAETSSNNATIASNSATKARIWAEGTDTEVEGILGEHSSKGWAEEAKRYATGNIIEALGYTPADDADLGALDAVAVKHTEQTLTTTQQAQARTNIDAVSSVELTAGLATKQGTLTFDTTPTANSSNPVTSDGIADALATKQNTLTFDSTPTANSSNPVTSGGIKTALDAKQDTLTFDSTPTADSNNPVTSQGIKAAIDAKDSLPSQTGHAGEYLKTDGETASWSNVESLPSQTGNAGKVLTTDGTTASWQPVQSRNVGEYAWSALPLTDAGLRLLDGLIISEGGIYDAFVQHVAGLSSSYPDAFCTETEWQASVNTYGSCGKFVYTQGTGVRLPKVSDILQGTTDVTAVGDLIEAGLPNITGTFNAYSWNNAGNAPTGAFKQVASEVVNSISSGNHVASRKIGVDASLSSTIYGKSTTVQPQSIKALLYICVANSVKTQIQVDIDNIATDLNGKADRDLSNATAPVLSAPYVVEDWRSGADWYRRWSSGEMEQGGVFDNGSNEKKVRTTLTFKYPFTDTNFDILISGTRDETSGYVVGQTGSRSKSKTGIFIEFFGNSENDLARFLNWRAKGRWK